MEDCSSFEYIYKNGMSYRYGYVEVIERKWELDILSKTKVESQGSLLKMLHSHFSFSLLFNRFYRYPLPTLSS